MTPSLKVKARRGTSLLETVVLVGLTSMTLTTMSMLTHSIFRSSSQISTRSRVRQVHSRILEQFSRDIQEGDPSALPTQENGEVCRIALTNGRLIIYQTKNNTLERISQDFSGKPEHREQFVLPQPYRFATIQRQPDGPILELQIHEEGAKDASGIAKSIPTGLRIVMVREQPSSAALGAQP